MHCPICHAAATKVIDSRESADGASIRRRRKCEVCQKRFTTYEQLPIHMPSVVKNDGRRETYDREKILIGIRKACHKRPISTEQILEIAEQIEKNMSDSTAQEISTTAIGEQIMAQLFQLDPVAYVRFASFYWNFKDIDDFVHSLQIGHLTSLGQDARSTYGLQS